MNLRFFLAVASALLLCSCTNNIDSLVPDVSAERLTYTRTGKFSSTTVECDNLKSLPDRVTADKVVVHHNNAWIPRLEIEAKGYSRKKTNLPAPAEFTPQ